MHVYVATFLIKIDEKLYRYEKDVTVVEQSIFLTINYFDMYVVVSKPENAVVHN